MSTGKLMVKELMDIIIVQ